MLKKRRNLAAIRVVVVTFLMLVAIHVIHDSRTKKPDNSHFEIQKETFTCSLGDLPSNDASTLLNITNFKYLINNNVCNTKAPPMIFAFVHSAPRNIHLRSRIRRTWGQELPLVFLIGETSNTLQKQIEIENTLHRDIVQGSFIDVYRNLTYKHIMGFKWAFQHCPCAKYILKTDDDVLVNVLFLRKYIESKLTPAGVRNLILCHKIHAPVMRYSKWKVSVEEYKDSWYPPQCLGWAVLYSPDVSFQLYKAAGKTPFFWIDDVFVTALLTKKLNISITPASPFVIYEQKTKEILLKPCLEPKDDFLFAYPGAGLIQETDKLWEIVQNTTRYLK